MTLDLAKQKRSAIHLGGISNILQTLFLKHTPLRGFCFFERLVNKSLQMQTRNYTLFRHRSIATLRQQ